MNVEDRLHDALRAYRTQVRPSPELLGRIESRTGRRAPTTRPWIALAAVVAVTLLIVTLTLRAGNHSTEVASGQRTRADLIAGTNRACDDVRRALRDANVVFPTATAYSVVASQRLAIARAALARAETLPDVSGVTSYVLAARGFLRAAVDAAERARTDAAAGALTDSSAALRDYDTAMAQAGRQFAEIGATRCDTKEGSTP